MPFTTSSTEQYMTKPSLRRTPPPKKTVRSVPERPDKVGKTGKTAKPGALPASAPPKREGDAKWVYSFGAGAAEGRAEMRDLLGGKGAGLAEMSSLGPPVPPGFTITTEICTHFYANAKTYPADLKDQVEGALAIVENAIGARFGDP